MTILNKKINHFIFYSPTTKSYLKTLLTLLKENPGAATTHPLHSQVCNV